MYKIARFLVRWRRWENSRQAILVVVLIAAVLSGAGLNKYFLWSDEAETAMFGVNILEKGHLSAWDGRNLITFNGGEELDAGLQYHEFAPLQFYVASIGIGLFGQNTWAARMPFWLLGLASVWMLGLWTKRMFPGCFAPALPPLLLAFSVAWQLYTPQCRYYALTMFFSSCMLWAITLLSEKEYQRRAYIVGAIATAGLFISSPITGAAMVIACLPAMIHPGFRSREHLSFVIINCVVILLVSVQYLFREYNLLSLSTLQTLKSYQVQHVPKIIGQQIAGLSSHEFFPLAFMPLALLPFVSRRLVSLRPMSFLALTVIAMMMTLILVVAIASPQIKNPGQIAEMSYLLPIIIMGTVITSVALTVVSHGLGRMAGAILMILLIFSNIPYGLQPEAQCTICKRYQELRTQHPSGGESFTLALASMPKNSLITIFPPNFVTIAEYYYPYLLYAGVLNATKELSAEIKFAIPSYVFSNGVVPEYLLLGNDGQLPGNIAFRNNQYNAISMAPLFYKEWTRPEIPQHSFSITADMDKKNGVIIFRRIEPPPSE